MRRRLAYVVAAVAAITALLVLPGLLGSGPGPPEGAAGQPPAAVEGTPSTIRRGPDGRRLLEGWRFRADPSDRGLGERWQRGSLRGRPVSLPHVPGGGAVTGRRGLRNFQGSVGWYRVPVAVERSGRYAIRFESAHHRAQVWLDGRRLGAHTGAYLPWEVRPQLEGGRRHQLTVRVDWRDPIGQKRDAWHRTWFNYGGLHREVTIRPLGASEVVAPTLRTRVRSGGEGAEVEVGVRVRNHGPSRRIAVEGVLTHAGRSIEIAFPAVRVGRGRSAKVRSTVMVAGPELWSPAQPALHDLRLEVPGESGWSGPVGLREISARGGRLMLNGRRLVLRGASLHEDAAGRGDGLLPADQDRIVAMLRRLGANATRAQHPLHPALLERLDAAGILVWQEVGPVDSPGNWTSTTPARRRRATRRVRTTLGEAQTHPSILAWNLANEVADNGHDQSQAAWIDGMARELHRSDPGRPVALDTWGEHLPAVPGRMYRNIDLIGTTDYVGWYELPHAPEGELVAEMDERLDRLRRLFPDKVLVVTEFGAEGNRRNPAARHGGFERQARLIDLHLRTYRRTPHLDGALVWNLTDFGVTPTFLGGSIVNQAPDIRLTRGLNEKGLWDRSGRPKPAVRVVRRRFAEWDR